ncbi:MAG: YncE family protein [Deltaproteobacteria bacterium]|nr:YncE family protein [Deltaproteobacteria bacterium]
MRVPRHALPVFLVAALLLVACDDLSVRVEGPPPAPVGEERAAVPKGHELLSPGHLDRAVERVAIPTCRRPMGAAVDRRGRIWLACALLGELQLIDPDSMSIQDTYGPVFEHLFYVDLAADDRYVVTAGMAGQFLHVFDATTGRRRDAIRVGRSISDIERIPGTNRYVVASAQDKTVTVVDVGTRGVDRTIEFPGHIGYIAVGKTGEIAAATGGLWVRDERGTRMTTGKVYLFNPNSDAEGRVAQSLTVDRTSREPVFVKGDSLLLAPNFGEGTVSVFDVAGATLARKLDVGEGPERLVVDPDGEIVYCLNTRSSSISVIRVSPPMVVRDIDLPSPPEFAAVTPDNKMLVVTLPARPDAPDEATGNRLALIDVTTMSLVDLIPAGDDPAALTASPDGRRFYVSNFLGNSLSIFH